MYKHNDEMVFADLIFSAQHCWNLLDLFRTNSDSIRVLDLSYNQGMQCKLEDIVERMGVGSGTSTSSASTTTPFAGIAHLNLGRCFFVSGDIRVLGKPKNVHLMNLALPGVAQLQLQR